ncbi:MAG: CPBP family intramembrane metalloprotease [Syntrophomonadaceae bacterium]|nr:CPBP family intramembrane metalloprotease [Syntrophomonadaceae bacterium]
MQKLQKPQWGFADLIAVYIGIFLLGMFYGLGRDVLGFNTSERLLANFYTGFVVQFTAMVGLVLLVTILIRKAVLSDIGLNRISWDDFIKYGLMGGFILIVVIFILGLPINYFQPNLEPQAFETMLRTSVSHSDIILLFIIGAILGPFAEELFFRGMMYPVFRNKFGSIAGMVLAGAVFGLLHFDAWRAIPLAVGGIILCYIYEKTNSVLITTVAHGFWNACMALLVFISI